MNTIQESWEVIYKPNKKITDIVWITYPEKVKELILQNVGSLSTVDSRHIASTYPLRDYFSEMALHKYRTKVELIHFIQMSQSDDFPEVPKLTNEQIFKLYKIIENFDKNEAIKVVEYDHFWRNEKWATEHDVKSIEYYIGEKLDELWMWDYKSKIHIYCTSEDINNIAYHSMLRDAMNNVMLPKLRWILSKFSALVEEYKDSAMMARTHWQPASPTTFWKEIAVFLARLQKNLERLWKLTLDVKFNWAVWNYNSHVLAKPWVDWIEYSEELAQKFWFDTAYLTNQRWPMTENVALFQIIQNLNRTLIDFCQDIWTYNSKWNVYHRKIASEIWSSVMPQKVNPWFLEEAEWLLKAANDIFETFVKNNDISRMQRDMTWHPHERNYWDAFGQTLTAWTNILESLSRIWVDTNFNENELNDHPEVVTEWIQTILRREGGDKAYELLKAIVRWKKVTLQTLYDFIEYLWQDLDSKWTYDFFDDIPEDLQPTLKSIQLKKEVIDDLRKITPTSFIWLARQLAEEWNKRFVEFMKKFDKKVALTTRERINAILFDLDNTLQLWDKEELKARLSSIVKDLALSITDDEMQEVYSLSCFREMKTKMVQLAKNHWVEVDEMQIQTSNDKVSWNFDNEFYLDDWARELIDLLNKNNISLWIISTRWKNSLMRVINEVHKIWDKVDVIISRDDVEEKKPDPEWVEKALERLEIGSDNIYYIWDKFHEDIEAWKNAWVIPIYIERTDEWISLTEKWETLTFKNMVELYNYFYHKFI